MMSAGFQWGINNTNDKLTNQHQHQHHLHHCHTPRSSSIVESSLSRKRKRRAEDGDGDVDDIDVAKADKQQDDKFTGKSFTSNDRGHSHRKQFNFNSNNNSNTTSFIPKTTTSTSSSAIKYKRSKTPRIIGQPLPPSRIIESLDKSDLTKLITSLIDIHPELNQTVSKIAQPPNMNSILHILQQKHESILKALPYKCDSRSDYSYLRIKPNLVDFLNCLEDYILWILPPNQHGHDLITQLWFLHELTNLIHKLPNFTNLEFQYTRNLIYETIINCWIIIFNEDLANDAIFEFFRKRQLNGDVGREEKEDGEEDTDDEDELIEKLRVHQRYCSKFGQIVEIYQEKLHQYKLAMREQYMNGSIGGDGISAGAAGSGATTGNSGAGVNNGNNFNGDGTVATNARLNEFVTVDYSQYSLNNPFR